MARLWFLVVASGLAWLAARFALGSFRTLNDVADISAGAHIHILDGHILQAKQGFLARRVPALRTGIDMQIY